MIKPKSQRISVLSRAPVRQNRLLPARNIYNAKIAGNKNYNTSKLLLRRLFQYARSQLVLHRHNHSTTSQSNKFEVKR